MARHSRLVVSVLVLMVVTCFQPDLVMAVRNKVVKASKDATLGKGNRGFCPRVPCDNSIANCPFCNQGSTATLEVNAYEYPSDALIGFDLSSIPKTANVISCKLVLPKPGYAPKPSSFKPQIRIDDTYYNWDELKVTTETAPQKTKVGSYGLYNPFANPPVDVTRGCKNRLMLPGNGLSLLLTIDASLYNTSIEQPSYIFSYKSREAKRPAKLFIKYT